MESPSGHSLPIPRLRLSRNAHYAHFDHPGSQLAGPSRLSDNSLAGLKSDLDEHDDDQQSTPKLAASNLIPPLSDPSPVETPAARLRALLSRVPNQLGSKAHMPQTPAHFPPSEIDSDFDALPTPATPSIARESLKDLFSHALRDPGGTPQKGRRRRNSIDVSEVEASPRVERERAKNKGKRRSLSDEELEKPSNSSQRPEGSFRSSQAAAFDTLRERLSGAPTQLKDQPPTPPYEWNSALHSNAPADDSHDTATFLRDLHFPQTSPVTTSTPQRSLQMSQFPFQSNLLEQDSEMQRAMKGLDSYEGASELNQHPVPFPPSNSQNAQPSPGRSRSALSHAKSHSLDKSHGATQLSRRASRELLGRPSSRASSLSGADYKERRHDEGQERLREREWNKPHPKTPARSDTPELKHCSSQGSGSRSGSPMVGVGALNGYGMLSRRSSAASLGSFDDDASSRTSSFGSQAEYRERINELERERNIEREREWNKRSPKLTRPTSSLSLHSTSERTRTPNHPARPDSAHLSPGFHRHHSFSGASSPSSSVASKDEDPEEEVIHEIVHERERNWNAPRPTWHHHPSGQGSSRSYNRTTSPMPPSPSPSSPSSTHLHTHSNGRVRAESLQTNNTAQGDSIAHRSRSYSHVKDSHSASRIAIASKASPRPSSPLPHQGTKKQSPSHPQLQRSQTHHPDLHRSSIRPTSPLPPEKDVLNKSPIQTSTLDTGSRLGYQFSRNQPHLPPIELDEETPARPLPSKGEEHPQTLLSSLSSSRGSRPTSRASNTMRVSHIPVKSPKKGLSGSTSKSSADIREGGSRKGPTSITAEDTAELDEATLPPVNTEPTPSTIIDRYETLSEPDEEIPQEVTPTIRTISPPPIDAHEYMPSRSPPPPLPHQRTLNSNDETRLHRALTSAVVTQELSPPPSPPSDTTPPQPQPTLSHLSTPPRRSSFSASKIEFQTPSPPKGLPELPGPPSSSEGEEDQRQFERTPVQFNKDAGSGLTSTKTPKFPGAWAATPMPERHNAPIRALSVPVEPEDIQYDGGLATPVASLSRASSMPPQTPAPPGAWTATPAPRRSILKVRFDMQHPESEQTVSNLVDDSSSYPSDSLEQPPQAEKPETKPGATNPPSEIKKEETEVHIQKLEPSTPPTPVSPRSPRKFPSIRVLDAFGREGTIDKQERPKPSSATSTARNRSGVRIVDAMGREVDVEPSSEVQEELSPLNHKEALTRVRHGLADLAQGLGDMDRTDDHIQLDQARLDELDDMSRSARETREKISQTLQMAQNAEDDLRSRFGSLRASMKRSQLLTRATIDRRLPWAQMNGRIFWGIVSLQLLLLFVMYRISTARARDLFLTTYYDPFYADLHLYNTKPDTLRHTIPSSLSQTSWSVFSIPNTLRREGWKVVAAEIWDNFAVVITNWQTHAWETWGAGEIQQNASWPPT